MPDVSGKQSCERFYPETRGWAALRLVRLVPPVLRREIEEHVPRDPRNVSFQGEALALVSRPRAIAWAREVAARVPALGVAAGPAAVASLWVARLLRPVGTGPNRGGGLECYWPDVVACVWNFIRPALKMVGISTSSPHREELEHEVAAPLALVFLKSLAAGRKDLRLVGEGDPDRRRRSRRAGIRSLFDPYGPGPYGSGVNKDVNPCSMDACPPIPARRDGRRALRHKGGFILRPDAIGTTENGCLAAQGPDGPPFGWAPGIDSLRLVVRYLLLGQVPGRFRSHAFLSSPLAHLLRAAGLAVSATVTVRLCPRCRTRWPNGASVERCLHCGAPLLVRRGQRLVARARLERSALPTGGGASALAGRLGAVGAPGGRLTVVERAEARQVGRECLRRAEWLWERVVRGRRHSVAAMVVLGALAGVRPLVAMADRPPPRRQWLVQLVEVLVEARLDREPLATEANEVLQVAARRLRRRSPPPITPGYVGVLATRFRHAVLGPRASRV